MPHLPNKVQPGEDIKAATINGLLDCVRAIWPKPGGDVWPSVSEAGTTFRTAPSRPRPGRVQTQDLRRPPFFVYATGAAKVKVTGGNLVHLWGNRTLWVDDTPDPLTVADGDYVWLERTGADAWAFNKGGDFPTDKISITLAQCAVDGEGVVSLDYEQGWHGGDIVIQETFPVALEATGEITPPALPTYTVKTLSPTPITLLETATPVREFVTNRIVVTPATDGIAWIKADGSIGFTVLNEQCRQCTPFLVELTDYYAFEARGGYADSCEAAECGILYKFSDAGTGIDLSGETFYAPQQKRIPNVEYEPATDGYGLAYYEPDGTLRLLCMFNERPVTSETLVGKDLVMEEGTLKLKRAKAQIFKTNDDCDESADIETDPSDVTECP